MKLHDLRPAEGSHKPRTRVGRGIAAGKGKTAGRGTKGQKARAGGSIPPWFEGGQTPLHMRIPKLRGFKNRFRVEYEVVNVGAIEALVERGAFETQAPSGKAAKPTKGSAGAAQITINADILRAVGLVRTPSKPLKILGAGDLSAALFVVADAFTASARAKIEAAGGIVNVLEVPATSIPALGVDGAETAGRRIKPAADAAPVNEAAAEEAPVAVAPPEDAPIAKAAVADAKPAIVDAETEETPAKATKAKATKTEETPAKAPVQAPAKVTKSKATKAKAPAEVDEPAAETTPVELHEAATTSGDDA